MTRTPQHLKYTETHQWAQQELDDTVLVGITDHAQAELGDLVYIQFPKIGQHIEAGKPILVVESVKAASDVYAPLSGTITAINDDLIIAPEQVNEDAYKAWLIKVKPDDPGELNHLLDGPAYEHLITAQT
jgi:glycine cleavage system H protein